MDEVTVDSVVDTLSDFGWSFQEGHVKFSLSKPYYNVIIDKEVAKAVKKGKSLGWNTFETAKELEQKHKWTY